MPADSLQNYYKALSPRWTWRPVILASIVTLALYLLLPYLEQLTSPPERTAAFQRIDTAIAPPPPPPPPPPQRSETKPETPKPELQEIQRRLMPLQARMDLSMALGDIGGDFAVNFGISTPDLADQIKELVFDIGDLDEPPRPLARLTPIYPPQARMQRIEGVVIVEFIVNPAGTVSNIEVMSAQPGDIFTGAAVRAIERWRFSPGRKDGQAVTTRVRQTVTFKLE